MTPAVELKKLRVAQPAFKKQVQQLSQQVAVTQVRLMEEQQLRLALQTENRNLKAEIQKLKNQIQTQTLQATATDLPNVTPTPATAPTTTTRAAQAASEVSPATTEVQAQEKAAATLPQEELTVASLQQALDQANARSTQLQTQVSAKAKTKASFVRANKKKLQTKQKSRKKRAADQNGVRCYQTPTEPVSAQQLQACGKGSGAVGSSGLSRRRQILEIAAPPPVRVLEHQVYRSWCSYCQLWQEAPLDLNGQVLGQGRIGVQLANHICYLRLELRLPYRRLQKHLANAYGLEVSVGELAAVIQKVAKLSQSEYRRLKEEAQAHPNLHADETGWREDGINGYIWALSTEGAEAVRYYEYHHSRSGATAKSLIGANYKGTLSTDFYGSYNGLAQSQQRCWVHLLRDLKELEQDPPNDPEVGRLVQLYREGRAAEALGEAVERQEIARKLEKRSHELGLQYARVTAQPCQALSKRLLRYENELFVFVELAWVSSNNNLAERSVRPLVVWRKLSGGSRSAAGSKALMVLASLYETWKARGLNVLSQMGQLLTLSQKPLLQV